MLWSQAGVKERSDLRTFDTCTGEHAIRNSRALTAPMEAGIRYSAVTSSVQRIDLDSGWYASLHEFRFRISQEYL